VRLNLHLRGIDLLDVEFHCGSKGLYLDVNVFQPREQEKPEDTSTTTADLSGTTSGSYERADGPVWADDQPALVRSFGFGPGVA
jgi:hypothetical protein